MELKPGYKQTEVGVIPEDWECFAIGSGIDLLTGFPFPSRGYSQSGIRLLRGSNVKRGDTDWSEDLTQYWPAITSEIRKYVLKANDIVIAMDGSLVGRSFAMLSKRDVPSVLLQRVARLRSESITQSYLKAWICSERFTKHSDAVKTVTAIPHISPADIRSFKIALPPTKAEQEAIAGALSDADALAESLEQLMTKKRQIKQGAMQELLTPKEGNNPKRLGDLLEFKNGLNKSKEFFGHGKPIVNYMDVFENPVMTPMMLKGRVYLTNQERANFDVRNGDVFFTRTSETPEEVGMASVMIGEPHDTVFSGFVLRARPKNDALRSDYAAYALRAPAVRTQIISKASYTTRALTNGRVLSEIVFAIPSIDEQAAIAAILSDMDAEITALEAKLTKARQVKQGMMQELLTGRIRLV